MRIVKIPLATIVLAVLAAGTIGCTNWEKKYKSLQGQYADLSAEHAATQQQAQQLRSDLSQCESKNTRLQLDLKASESDLKQANREIAKLEDKVRGGDTPPPPRPDGETRIITLGSDVLFAPGRATLTDGGKRALAGILAKLRGQYAGMTVRVYGYTDGDPIRRSKKLWKDNLDLSANRAMAVTHYLRDNGVDAERIETVAMGKTHPVAPNKTAAGKAKNRRVEISVVSR
ncbi:MAG: OmpA family protein [Phycisphaerae bacterium]|nr:OmpA family protein [Phycisphaerae bacterium]